MRVSSLVKLLCINATVLASMLLSADVLIAFLKKDSSPRRISAVYHHAILPNKEFAHEWVAGKRIIERTNTFGFRFTRSDHSVRKLNEYKTVVIGDSFTEGVGLRYEQVFASLLPSQFNPVANMGVISYSPSIYSEKLLHYKKRGLDPEYLIQIVDVSDIQDEYHYHREGFVSIPMPSFIEDTRLSQTKAYIRLVKTLWALNRKEPFTTNEKQRNWSVKYYAIRDPYTLPSEPSYYQEGKTLLTRGIERSIKAFPRANHYVIAYNWGPNQMTGHGKTLYSKYIVELRDALRKYPNSNFCDMTDVVKMPGGYIKGDIHWSHTGNQQMTNSFYANCFNHASN